MDLISAFSHLQAATTMTAIQYAVARKAINAQKVQGDAAIRLIEAATTNLSNAADNTVAATTGLGHQVDVAA